MDWLLVSLIVLLILCLLLRHVVDHRLKKSYSVKTVETGRYTPATSRRNIMVRKRYQFVKTNAEGKTKIDSLREAFSAAHDAVLEALPETSIRREKALVDLESAFTFATKAISRENVVECDGGSCSR